MRFDRLAMLGCGLAAFYGLAMIHIPTTTAGMSSDRYWAEIQLQMLNADSMDGAACFRTFTDKCRDAAEAQVGRIENTIAALKKVEPPVCLSEIHSELISALMLASDGFVQTRDAAISHKVEDNTLANQKLGAGADAMNKVKERIKPTKIICS